MRRALALALLLAVVGAGAAVVAGAGTAPIWTGSVQDGTGDSGPGPDISTLSVTVGADQKLTLAVKLSNRGGLSDTESVQFFIRVPQTDAQVNLAYFGDGEPPTLNTWVGSDWQTYHQVTGTFSDSTFTTTLDLGDLQNALQTPVRPGLWISVKSYTGAVPDTPPVQADAAPDDGYMPVQTQAAAPAATTTTTATPPPVTTTTSRAKGPTHPVPVWSERIVRLPHARIEWKRLVLTHVPAGAQVSIACTKRCARSERLRVVRGTATSKRFVGVPFSRGQVFVAKVIERDGAGWWWQTTVVAHPGGQETATREGCYLADGTSLPLAKC